MRMQDVRVLAMERRAPEAPPELDRARARREGHAPRGLPRLLALGGLVRGAR